MSKPQSFVVSAFDSIKFTAHFPDSASKTKFYTADSLNKANQANSALDSAQRCGEGTSQEGTSQDDLIAYSTYFTKRIRSEFGFKVIVNKGYETTKNHVAIYFLCGEPMTSAHQQSSFIMKCERKTFVPASDTVWHVFKELTCACQHPQNIKLKLAGQYGIKDPVLAQTFSHVCQSLANSFVKAEERSKKEKDFLLKRKSRIADKARKIVLESLESLLAATSSSEESSSSEEEKPSRDSDYKAEVKGRKVKGRGKEAGSSMYGYMSDDETGPVVKPKRGGRRPSRKQTVPTKRLKQPQVTSEKEDSPERDRLVGSEENDTSVGQDKTEKSIELAETDPNETAGSVGQEKTEKSVELAENVSVSNEKEVSFKAPD